jgi:hypothetical protein
MVGVSDASVWTGEGALRDGSYGQYSPSGDLFDGCTASMFDYEVITNEQEEVAQEVAQKVEEAGGGKHHAGGGRGAGSIGAAGEGEVKVMERQEATHPRVKIAFKNKPCHAPPACRYLPAAACMTPPVSPAASTGTAEEEEAEEGDMVVDDWTQCEDGMIDLTHEPPEPAGPGQIARPVLDAPDAPGTPATAAINRRVLRLDMYALEALDDFDPSDNDDSDDVDDATDGEEVEAAKTTRGGEKARAHKKAALKHRGKYGRKYQECIKCGETEWHASASCPGEPILGRAVAPKPNPHTYRWHS